MSCSLLDAVHPVIRVICFLIVSLCIALGSVPQFYLALLLVVILGACYGARTLTSVWPMLRRLRWFFLSILLIYWWLTPGQALWQGAPAWLPSVEGLGFALHRIAVLVIIIAMVGLLLRTMRREQLISALYWLASPLRLIGMRPEQFALRVVMALECVAEVQGLVAEAVKARSAQMSKLEHYGTVATAVFTEVLLRGDLQQCTDMELEIGVKPPLTHWILPLCLVVAFYGVSLISG